MNAFATTPASSSATASPSHRGEPALLPPVDVIEDPQGITLFADIPGVPRDRLDLRVEGDTLSIEADLAVPLPQGMTPSHAEVQLARYRRAFTLSKELDASKVSAELSHGVLRVRIPKAEHAQPRRISVQVA
ncbi:MAG: Hsp20/alpha crystallin family protein [Ideonella sp.]|jgi:HSP20 family molecular chaperone IbpA|nr:Hsp20/alpha crystallin family protein [Ideonella sp.]